MAQYGRFGPYEVLGELGRGAMAVVWRAWDPRYQCEVAIKEPLLGMGLSQSMQSELARRFAKEARVSAQLNHPGIVRVYDADVWDGRPGMVMELVDGETLAQRLARDRLQPQQALNVLDQLLDAVGYAHACGVVHRDIKPDNIFITRQGQVKLADFGIARVEQPMTTIGTMMGTILGTPGYMSPEQAAGMRADARSDLFSVGVVAYEILVGVNPFRIDGCSDSSILIQRTLQDPAPELPGYALEGLGVDVRPAVMSALDKDPAHRPQSASAFVAMLHSVSLLPPTPEPHDEWSGAQRAATLQTEASNRKARRWWPGTALHERRQTVADTLGRKAVADAASRASVPTTEESPSANTRQRQTWTNRSSGTSSQQQMTSDADARIFATGRGVLESDSSTLQREVEHTPGRPTPTWLPYVLALGIAAALLVVALSNASSGMGGGGASGSYDAGGQAGSQSAQSVQTEVPPTSSSGYYLAARDGKIAVFQMGSDTCVEVTDVSIANLSAQSIGELNRRTQVSALEEAHELVEGYRAEAEAQQSGAHGNQQQSQVEILPTANASPGSGSAPQFTSIEATSTLASNGSESFGPTQAVDGDATTAWGEGIDGTGASVGGFSVGGVGMGEAICLKADTEQSVHGVRITTGYPKDEKTYKQYNRCQDVYIALSDGTLLEAELEDAYRTPQDIDFNGEYQTTFMVVSIGSRVYKGSQYDATMIAEIEVY